MKKHKTTRILAIDPGTREIGIAVLEDTDLIYYGVKSLRNGKLRQRVLNEGKDITKRLIEDFEPDALAIEKTTYPRSKRSKVLREFSRAVKTIARARKVKVLEYVPREARKFICANGKPTKSNAAKTIASYYPELTRYLGDDSFRMREKKRYWMNMFDAVTLGIAYYYRDVAKKVSKRKR